MGKTEGLFACIIISYFKLFSQPSSNKTTVFPEIPDGVSEGNSSNCFSTINLLRILQKITKRNPHRIQVLLKCKSSVFLSYNFKIIIKKILKVQNQDIQLQTE